MYSNFPFSNAKIPILVSLTSIEMTAVGSEISALGGKHFIQTDIKMETYRTFQNTFRENVIIFRDTILIVTTIICKQHLKENI